MNMGEKWILKFLVYGDRLCSKATVRGNATMLRFMISGMPWMYTHTHPHIQCLQMMFKPFILNYSSILRYSQ